MKSLVLCINLILFLFILIFLEGFTIGVVVSTIKNGTVVSFETVEITSAFRRRGGNTVSGASWGSLTDLASTDSLSEVTTFQSFSSWSSEFFFDSRQPETESSAEVVASTFTVAFNEWSGSEGFQTRAGRLKILSSTTFASTSVHNKTETSPVDTFPVGWAVWGFFILRVDGNEFGWGFADNTSGDVSFEVGTSDVFHGGWHSFISGQPVRVIVSAGNVTLLVEVTEDEWHGSERSKTRAWSTKILSDGSFVTGGVEKRVTFPKFGVSGSARWNSGVLGVSGVSVTVVGGARTWGTWWTDSTLETWRTWWTFWTWFTLFAWKTIVTVWTGWTLNTWWTLWTHWAWRTWTTGIT